MTTLTKHAPGTFSWAELATTDAASAKKFYGGLFGWTYDDMPAGPDMIYSMTKLGKEHASALYKMGESTKGIPPHWESYITVEDVDATTKTAVANGAKLLKEPFDVMDVGRMAVVADPTGAVFCLWTAKKHIGASVLHDPGAMTWNELFTNDVERAGKFYTSTFGWTTQAFDMGPMGVYTLFSRAGDAKANTGGMMALGPQMKDVPPHWLVYFAVADCDASTKQAKDLGGTVLSPPMDIPNIGRFAVVLDPQGAVFALYKGAH
jgi:predicted enzyme related to lactoylglutathione lyase